MDGAVHRAGPCESREQSWSGVWLVTRVRRGLGGGEVCEDCRDREGRC